MSILYFFYKILQVAPVLILPVDGYFSGRTVRVLKLLLFDRCDSAYNTQPRGIICFLVYPRSSKRPSRQVRDFDVLKQKCSCRINVYCLASQRRLLYWIFGTNKRTQRPDKHNPNHGAPSSSCQTGSQGPRNTGSARAPPQNGKLMACWRCAQVQLLRKGAYVYISGQTEFMALFNLLQLYSKRT